MKLNKTLVVIKLIKLMMQFLLYYGIACFISGLFWEDTVECLRYLLLMAVPFFGMALIRRMAKHIMTFSALHILVIAVMFVMGRSINESLAIIPCAIAMTINSIRYRIVEDYKYEEKPHALCVLIFVALAFLAAYFNREMLQPLYYYMGIFYVLLQVICESLENTERFLEMNAETANLPAKHLKGVNRILLTFFVLLVLLAMFVFPKLHLEVFVKEAGMLLLMLLRFLFSFFKGGEAPAEEITEALPPENGGGNLILEPGETSWIAKILEQIFMAVGTIAIAAGVLAGIAYLLYQFYKRFYAVDHTDQDQKEFLKGDTLISSVSLFGRRRKKEERTASVNLKIRKLYRLYIKKESIKKEGGKKAGNMGLYKSLSPKEIEEYLCMGEETEQERKKRLELYEKGRYSSYECTKEELEQMKQLVNRRRSR